MLKELENGEVAAKVKIEISGPATITAMVTKEAVEVLDLKEGDKVDAVIKATSNGLAGVTILLIYGGHLRHSNQQHGAVQRPMHGHVVSMLSGGKMAVK